MVHGQLGPRLYNRAMLLDYRLQRAHIAGYTGIHAPAGRRYQVLAQGARGSNCEISNYENNS